MGPEEREMYAKEFARYANSESGWISVNDLLPPESGEYLVFGDGDIDIASFGKEAAYWQVDTDGGPIEFHPTHWMPLPDPPK